ncbi:MAG: hypothetical protein H7831_08440 [Magnetococcus sp. WYHC-3]
MTSPLLLSGWVTYARTSVSLGTMPTDRYLSRAFMHVTQAFNSDGTDLVQVGYTGDADAYATATDVSSTGVKSVTLGTLAGYNGTAHPVEITYTAGGSTPTTGKAYACLEFLPTPPAPV